MDIRDVRPEDFKKWLEALTPDAIVGANSARRSPLAHFLSALCFQYASVQVSLTAILVLDTACEGVMCWYPVPSWMAEFTGRLNEVYLVEETVEVDGAWDIITQVVTLYQLASSPPVPSPVSL